MLTYDLCLFETAVLTAKKAIIWTAILEIEIVIETAILTAKNAIIWKAIFEIEIEIENIWNGNFDCQKDNHLNGNIWNGTMHQLSKTCIETLVQWEQAIYKLFFYQKQVFTKM